MGKRHRQPSHRESIRIYWDTFNLHLNLIDFRLKSNFCLLTHQISRLFLWPKQGPQIAIKIIQIGRLYIPMMPFIRSMNDTTNLFILSDVDHIRFHLEHLIPNFRKGERIRINGLNYENTESEWITVPSGDYMVKHYTINGLAATIETFKDFMGKGR